MLNKKIYLLLVLLTLSIAGISQKCNYSIQGHVKDAASDLPLAYVNVYIQETSNGNITDDDGNFTITGICRGSYHLIFSHIGCAPEEMHIDLDGDTILQIDISHHETSLNTVLIEGQSNADSGQAFTSIDRELIENNSNQNLSNLLQNESGVSTLKNGSGIAKPIVHGLYGNRLPILNNGIIQSGQQWGNDHSPEIDPYSADKITVLKGVSALEYGGGNMGSVILVEPKHIDKDPHLHGQVAYTAESNGRGHTLNTRLQQYTPVIAWRISASRRKYGDRKTADYFLNNTGAEELNFSLQLEKSWNDKLFTELYASSFNTRLGILRGSHIGNTTDLDAALEREIPFFTEEDFSYTIDAPKQEVSHQLLKFKTKYFIHENQLLDLVIAAQSNDRKEFDVRRSGRSEIPALSLKQYTLNAELRYQIDFKNAWNFKIGNQYILTDNTNNPETDILPLIPDYISSKNGIYTTLSKNTNKLHYKAGLRYDYEYQHALTISNTFPREIIRFKNHFNNAAGLLSVEYDINSRQSIHLNTGYAMRNPAINELYSNGLHQGVSGIEEGDINLETEKALKTSIEYKWLPTTDFSFSTLLYSQQFSDYIYLNPQNQTRLTIRGAFPLFKYEQTDAHIYGMDISSQYVINNLVYGQVKYSYLKGQDTKNDIPLLFMPSNSLYMSISLQPSIEIKLTPNFKLEGLEIELNSRRVQQQGNLDNGQDFLPAPPAYHLLGFMIATDAIYQKGTMRFFAKADNLLNTQYRDYLNRQRYFADDLGISITMGLNIKF